MSGGENLVSLSLDFFKPNESFHLMHVPGDRFFHELKIPGIWIKGILHEFFFTMSEPPENPVEKFKTSGITVLGH